jgi:CheY-like chemotaxis protein
MDREDRTGNTGATASSWNGISRLDGVRVLVVESEPQVLELVVDALGQFGAHVPAAAFTGWTDVEDQRNARQAGFHVHLSKSVDLGKLAEVVALLSQKQSGGAADHAIHRDPRGIAS